MFKALWVVICQVWYQVPNSSSRAKQILSASEHAISRRRSKHTKYQTRLSQRNLASNPMKQTCHEQV